MLDETVCMQLFPHTRMCCPTSRCGLARHSGGCTLDFRDFSNGVCHVMKMTIADRNAGVGLLAQHFALAAMLWRETVTRLPTMTMSVASDWVHLDL